MTFYRNLLKHCTTLASRWELGCLQESSPFCYNNIYYDLWLYFLGELFDCVYNCTRHLKWATNIQTSTKKPETIYETTGQSVWSKYTNVFHRALDNPNTSKWHLQFCQNEKAAYFKFVRKQVTSKPQTCFIRVGKTVRKNENEWKWHQYIYFCMERISLKYQSQMATRKAHQIAIIMTSTLDYRHIWRHYITIDDETHHIRNDTDGSQLSSTQKTSRF